MSFLYISFTPEISMPPVIAASNEAITVVQGSSGNNVPWAVTQDGSPVTPSELWIDESPSNGTAVVDGLTITYTPNAAYFGRDAFTYGGTVEGTDSTPGVVGVTVTAPPCDEIGRTSRAVASAYYRTRVHDTRLMMGERRCLVADYNGVIAKARTIASVTWRCDFGYIAQMSNARIQSDNRSAAVDIIANWIGDSIIRCEATLDNGEVYIQPFRIDVSGDPIFMPAVSGNGPTVLTAP